MDVVQSFLEIPHGDLDPKPGQFFLRLRGTLQYVSCPYLYFNSLVPDDSRAISDIPFLVFVRMRVDVVNVSKPLQT